ncbi:MAG: cyclic pyranopterin monophosphate synthase MoaC [Deltaproteobacteria bacterium]|nr:cyclic pyranopterin monophosphate synthase MoaC [Deltaproteobacteria bacterium]
MKKLSHTDESGRALMVDVGYKEHQVRTATATGMIGMADETLQLIRENSIKKGDVLTTAEIAGIQAGKRTSDLIPLCHPLAITQLTVKAEIIDRGVEVTGKARCVGPTGIEMEALTAVSVALLTVYDMCKAVDKGMVISAIRLVEKTKEDVKKG